MMGVSLFIWVFLLMTGGKVHQLLWVEGSALTQQAFQYWDRYWQFQHNMLAGMVTAGEWGFLELDICRQSLSVGLLRIKKFILLSSMGQLISFDERESSYVLNFEPQSGDRLIYLQLGVADAVENITGYLQPYVNPQARAYHHICSDRYDAKRQAYIQLQEPMFRLLNHKDKASMWHVVVASISKIKGSLELDAAYIAPSLFVQSSTQLHEKLDCFLAFIRQLLVTHGSAMQADKMHYKQLLQVYHTRLSCMLGECGMSCRFLYMQLSELAAWFNINELSPEPYDPLRLSELVVPLFARIQTACDRIFQKENPDILRYCQLSTHTISIEGCHLLSASSRVMVECVTGQDNKEVIGAIRQQIKVALKSDIYRMVQYSLQSMEFDLVHVRSDDLKRYFYVIIDLFKMPRDFFQQLKNNPLSLYLSDKLKVVSVRSKEVRG